MKLETEPVAGPSKPRNQKRDQPKDDAEENQKDFYCTVCREQYTHPPIEDWIKCDTCQEWTHEACSSYTGRGSYFCDDCSG